MTISFIAPVHKHESSQEAACLICQVATGSDVVAIAHDAGKPVVAVEDSSIVRVFFWVDLEKLDRTSGSRGPPIPSASL